MTSFEIEILKFYFPKINSAQELQFKKLPALYKSWNEKINVISRKDIENLFIRHILHSLAIAKVKCFPDGSRVLDVGTGGGFPGIPLAVMFPDVKFTLIDSIAKKIKVTQEVADALELKNVKAIQIKSTVLKDSFDFITGRAVTSFPAFYNSVTHLLKKGNKDRGILYLKGGDFGEEIKTFKNVKLFEVSDIFDEAFYKTKKIIYLPIFH